MSKQVTKTVYRFDELSDEAKDRARDFFARNGYIWADYALASIKALAEHFGGTVKDYSIDFYGYYPSYMRFDMPIWDEDEDETKWIREQLDEINNGSCALTGYCADEDAIDGFSQAFEEDGTKKLNELMQSAFNTWLYAAQKDAEYLLSDKALSEMCDSNDYWFHENGEME